MFYFYASARKIEVKKSDILVSDSINVYPCKFQFSSDWTELTKTAVFRAGTTAIEILLDENLSCNIPWEVLLKDKLDLYVGCYGTKGDDIILNTTWTNIGKIYEGTKNKAVPGEDPTPDIYTQLASQIGDLSSLETSDKSSLVNAINEVKNSIGSGGGADEPLPAGVASFNGRTGAVLPQTGDYTAEMVGATPAADFETFRENVQEDIERIVLDTDDKLDKTGGVVTGSITFADTISTMSYIYEDEPVENTYNGVTIRPDGISKSSDGPLTISTVSKEVALDNETKIRGIVGDENIPDSVPNMEQVNQKVEAVKEEIPTKTSQLTNDSNFATQEYVQNAIFEIEGGADLTAGDGITIEDDTIRVTTPTRGILTQDEFDALPEEEQNKGLYVVDDGQSAGGGTTGVTTENVYSTEEVRIGTWIDGKPLYRICFNTKTAPSVGEAQQIVPLPKNINKVTNLLGQFECNNQSLFINYYGNAQYYVTTYVNYSIGYVVMNVSNLAYTNCPLMLVLEYTKTTDPEVTT